jgi:hypothetical protein
LGKEVEMGQMKFVVRNDYLEMSHFVFREYVGDNHVAEAPLKSIISFILVMKVSGIALVMLLEPGVELGFLQIHRQFPEQVALHSKALN